MPFIFPNGSRSESKSLRPQKVQAHTWGPPLWELLHSRPWLPNLDLETEAKWLACDFAKRIKAGSCQCRQHWMAYLKEVPPDLSSREAYLRWTFAAHNHVNKRREVAQWPEATALARWAPNLQAPQSPN